MLAGLQVFVGVEVIDHLVECIDLPRLQVGAAVRYRKGVGLKDRRCNCTVISVSLMALMTPKRPHQLPRRPRLALVVTQCVDDHPRPLLEAQVTHLLAAHRRAVHIGQHEHAQVRAVAPVVPLAAHHHGLAGLPAARAAGTDTASSPGAWRGVQAARSLPGSDAAAPGLARRRPDRAASDQGGFVDTAVFIGELLFQVVQGAAALRRELADVVERHPQEAARCARWA